MLCPRRPPAYLQPLTSAFGKKLVAKELGLWEGAHCYYCVGAAHHDFVHAPSFDPTDPTADPTADRTDQLIFGKHRQRAGVLRGGRSTLAASAGGAGGVGLGGGVGAGAGAGVGGGAGRYLAYDGAISTNGGYRCVSKMSARALLGSSPACFP